MTRGELYRVFKPGGDPKQYRIFAVVSRQVLIDSKFSTVICAPVFTCDNLVSMRKTDLTNYVGSLSPAKLLELNRALKMALDL